uniref:ACB domain-containing protein n=1 Tax=Caenorhabditis japonica TaxID=281687 RepID=A0A8R1E1G9_CAEJA
MSKQEDLFDTAVFVVQNLPKDGPIKTSTDEKLNFYALFKQATHGDCDTAKPGFYDVQGVYKWNAWKKLEQTTSEEAKQAYVEALIQKVRHVQQTHKTEEWMKGETFDLLGPKFEILGVDLSGAATKEPKEPKEAKEEGTVELEPVEKEEKDENTANSSACALSDGEYADALDEEQQSRSSSFTSARLHRRQNSPSLKSSCLRLEKELKVITESIDKLGKAVEDRHNLLLTMMKKATVYILVPRASSWRTVIFFVFWPFIAHFLIRWLRRFLAFI